jgi:uncharacterized protein (TIGR03083 family)
MAAMTPSEWIDSFEEASSRIIDLTARNPDRPVPSCPGWAGRDLLRHIGMTPAIWRTLMETEYGDTPMLDFSRVLAVVPNDDLLAPWARSETSDYARCLRQRDPAGWAWNAYPNQTSWMWMRRAASETAVHLWDAESMVGSPNHVDGRVAADGLDELVDMLGGFLTWSTSAPGLPLTLVATDAERTWTYSLAGVPASNAGTVQGPASALFLRFWGRPSTGLSGAVDLLDEWAALPFDTIPPGTVSTG